MFEFQLNIMGDNNKTSLDGGTIVDVVELRKVVCNLQVKYWQLAGNIEEEVDIR